LALVTNSLYSTSQRAQGLICGRFSVLSKVANYQAGSWAEVNT